MRWFPALLAALILSTADVPNAHCEKGRSGQVVFDTAEEALRELRTALKDEDVDRVIEIFGKPAEKIFNTGDPVSDKRALRRMSQRFDQRAELFPVLSEEYANEQWYLVRYATEGWNMHIPLVNRGKGWNFASEYATDANLNIRKMVNEIAVVDTMLALVKAQEEYHSKDYNGDGVLEYAQRFVSTPGRKDGLYWPAEGDGSSASPLDGIAARAIQDGYKLNGKGNPYGGYYYRILTGQGGRTRGGKKSYMSNGKMTGGYAFLAYPGKYGAAGDSCFMVTRDGQVWKRDFGPRTESIASDIESMNLDFQWVRADPHLGGKNSRVNW